MLRFTLLLAPLVACSGGDDEDPTSVPEDFTDGVLAAAWASDMTVDLSGDTLTLEDDGVPDHDVLQAYLLSDNSTVGVIEYGYTFEIPSEPVYSDTVTETGLGTIGVAISGGVYFNPYEGDGTSVALDGNFEVDGIPFLDACSGHPLPSGDNYHYHGVPYCITDVVDTDGEHSVMIGVLLDGFPIYGHRGEGGDAPTDLDECSGHTGPTPEFPDGVYHYHLTETAPYSIECFHGEVEVSDMGGPPDGGPPM